MSYGIMQALFLTFFGGAVAILEFRSCATGFRASPPRKIMPRRYLENMEKRGARWGTRLQRTADPERRNIPLTAYRPAGRLNDRDYETSAQSILSNSRPSPYPWQATGEPRGGGIPTPVFLSPAVLQL